MDWQHESRMFDQMAEYYDRFRPNYPEGIIQALISSAGLSQGSKILEAGAGSGKATGQLAGRGYDITCVEPGPALCRVGQARFSGEPISFVAERFEDYKLTPEIFDLVFSAQAWHWVPQPEGVQLSARALKSGGYLGILYNYTLLPEGEGGRELERICARYGMGQLSSIGSCEKRILDLTEQIAGSGLFAAPHVFREWWCKAYNAEEYYGLALTGNVFVQHDDAKKETARLEIADFAKNSNGIIKQSYLSVLLLAKLKEPVR